MSAAGGKEAESNLRVSLMVAEELRRYGVEVLMTRTTPGEDLELSERCAMANEADVDRFISLHADSAGGNPGPRGHHVMHSIHGGPGKALARAMVDSVALATGVKPFPRGDRGVWSRESERNPGTDYYGIIRGAKMPAVIMERGFLSNPQEAAMLFDEKFLRTQARGIARGVASHLGINTEEVATSMFVDVQSHWAKGDIEFLASMGLVKGDEAGRFRPDEPITRAETAVLLSRTIRLLQGGVRD